MGIEAGGTQWMNRSSLFYHQTLPLRWWIQDDPRMSHETKKKKVGWFLPGLVNWNPTIWIYMTQIFVIAPMNWFYFENSGENVLVLKHTNVHKTSMDSTVFFLHCFWHFFISLCPKASGNPKIPNIGTDTTPKTPNLPLWKKGEKSQLPLCSPNKFDQVSSLEPGPSKTCKTSASSSGEMKSVQYLKPIGTCKNGQLWKSALEKLKVVWFAMVSYSVFFLERFRKLPFTTQKNLGENQAPKRGLPHPTARTCFGPCSREPNSVIGVDQDTSTVSKPWLGEDGNHFFFRFMVVILAKLGGP